MVGRSAELDELSAAWRRAEGGEPQLAVVWGRRRVGKTFLLTHLARGKRGIFFTATRGDSDERQLLRLAERIREQLGDEVRDLVPETFPDWESALRFVVRLAERGPLLVVIDEAPRLTSNRSDFADVVSAVWENRVRDQRLLLVLSGSAVTVMERMLGPHGGLHHRAAVERRMDPFDLTGARALRPELHPEDLIQAYAACGGYPLHLLRWAPDDSVPDNLRRLGFTPGGLLLRDATDILSEDLDWRGGYERVLTAMAGGARRRSRIAGRAHQRIDYTLDRLRKAGFVRVVRPIGEPATADPLYEIADDYLAYWFAVLRDEADLIEGGQGPAVQRRMDGRWQTHLARVFEAQARSHAQRLVAAGELPEDMVVGRWWKDQVAEIDVLGLGADGSVLVGECRWQARPIVERDVVELQRRLARVPVTPTSVRYAFWSRGGAAPGVAERPDVCVFTPADLLTPS